MFDSICFLNFPVRLEIFGKKTSANYWERIFYEKKLRSILMGMNIKTIVAFAIRLENINQITMRYSQVVIALDP